MAKPPKSIAMLALGSMRPKGGGDDDMGAEPPADGPDGGDDDSEGLQMAMSDLLEAIEAKNPQAMADAFKSAKDIC